MERGTIPRKVRKPQSREQAPSSHPFAGRCRASDSVTFRNERRHGKGWRRSEIASSTTPRLRTAGSRLSALGSRVSAHCASRTCARNYCPIAVRYCVELALSSRRGPILHCDWSVHAGKLARPRLGPGSAPPDLRQDAEGGPRDVRDPPLRVPNSGIRHPSLTGRDAAARYALPATPAGCRRSCG